MNSYETEVPNNLRDALDRRRAQNSSGTTRRIPVVRRPRENDGPNYDGASSSQAIFGLVPEDEEDPNESNNMESLVDEMWHSRFPRGERSPQISQPQIDEQMLEPFMSSIPYGRATSDLLESVRRQSRLPSNVRPPYLPDNTDDQETERERRPVPWTTTSGTRPGAVRTAFPLHLTEARNAHVREMYIKDPSAHRLKEAIKYLDRVRFSSSYEESLTEAAVGGFVQLEYFLHNEDDFILNTGFISNPPECSWLRPGAVLSGFQQATHNAVPTRSAAPTRPTDPVIVNGSDPNRIAVGTSSGRRYWARNSADLGDGPTPLTEPKTEQWPVKVTIHDIDPNSMTLSATMEAYNIPDKSDPDQKSHIITYVEGEIIDFNTHTLQTKNFKAGADIDTCYWKKLEPFKGMTPDEIVKNLISKKWITEYLAKGWILMRWKGWSLSYPLFPSIIEFGSVVELTDLFLCRTLLCLSIP